MLLLILVLAASAGAQSPQRLRAVVVISIDGLRGDAAEALLPPALRSAGAVTFRARTVVPSSTLPAHASMLTGWDVAGHGVRHNNWRKGDAYVGVPTVMEIATRAGMGAEMIVAKLKLEIFARPGSVRLFRYLPYPRYRADGVLRQAAERLGHRPALLFVHVADPDDAGHRWSWESHNYRESVRRSLEALAGFLEGASRSGIPLTVIVTSDHGGLGRRHGGARPEEVTIPWLVFGSHVRAGGTISQAVRIYDTAATALWLLGIPVPGDWDGRAVTDAFR
ncbi:MAG: alkaline phosphatase family protein [Armatimonadota bacterium]|nr:alkaline phosphatase family protein [Armatimonadota bacterium]MDR5697809.1 alkaline phosphatase family protein [Armatimonadota bacterium]